MTAAELRALAQRVVETYAACEALGDDHTVGEWIAVDEARYDAEQMMDSALGLSLGDDDDRSEMARAILAALNDAERVATERVLGEVEARCEALQPEPSRAEPAS